MMLVIVAHRCHAAISLSISTRCCPQYGQNTNPFRKPCLSGVLSESTHHWPQPVSHAACSSLVASVQRHLHSVLFTLTLPMQCVSRNRYGHQGSASRLSSR